MDPRRRLLLTAGAGLLFCRAADAAPPARIAYVAPGSEKNYSVFLDALRQGLRDFGLVEGRDYVVDAYWLEGRYDLIPEVMARALSQNPQVIVPGTIAAVRRAKEATSTVPIVMPSINDPVAAGLIANYARPGANVTGVSNMAGDTSAILVQLVREVMPSSRLLAYLFNPGNPQNLRHVESLNNLGGQLGLGIELVEFPRPRPAALAAVFAGISGLRPQAILVARDGGLLDMRDDIVEAAMRIQLPVFSPNPEFAAAGAVIGFGSSVTANYRRAAYYVKRVLAGENPAKLPVEQPTRVFMEINLKSARSLGLSVPQSVLLRADRIIE